MASKRAEKKESNEASEAENSSSDHSATSMEGNLDSRGKVQQKSNDVVSSIPIQGQYDVGLGNETIFHHSDGERGRMVEEDEEEEVEGGEVGDVALRRSDVDQPLSSLSTSNSNSVAGNTYDVIARGTISDDLKVFADFLEKY